MSEIKYSGQPTFQDYVAFQRLARNTLLWNAGTAFAILLLFKLFFSALTLAAGPKALLFHLLPAIVLSAVWVTSLTAIQNYFWNKNWKNAALLQKAVTGSVNEVGVLWEIEGEPSSRKPWPQFLGYRESDSMTLVYVTANQMLFFPRHYFKNDSNWADFREVVRQKLAKR